MRLMGGNIDSLLKEAMRSTATPDANLVQKVKNKIVEEERNMGKTNIKRSFGAVAAACIAAAIMSATVLAMTNVIDMSVIYRFVFGENSEKVEQYIEPLAASDGAIPANKNTLSPQSEYDGIVIKLLSAVNDENLLRIFASVTDTKGDRPEEPLRFANWGLSKGYGGGVEVVDYNSETKTTVLMISSLGSDHQGDATLTISKLSVGPIGLGHDTFIDGNWEFALAIPEKATTEFYIDGEIPINGDLIHISVVSLSPIGVTIHLAQSLSGVYSYNDTVCVEYDDGSVIQLPQSAIHTYEHESTLIFGGQVVEIENARAIFINGQRIDVQKETDL